MQVTTAARPKTLAEATVRGICDCADPWAVHWIVTARQGLGDWILHRCAAVAGIVVSTKTVTLRTLLETVASSVERPAWSAERLGLAIARDLPRFAGLLPVPEELGTLIDGRRLSWGQAIAAAIDSTLLCRGTIDSTSPIAQLVADPAVASHLDGHLGLETPTHFGETCAAWVAERSASGRLPQLWLVLDQALSKHELQLLEALLAAYPAGQAQVLGLEPASVAWDDIDTGRGGRSGAEDEEIGPVLPRFGHRLRELHTQGADTGWFERAKELTETAGPTGAERDSLLARLQAACRAGSAIPSGPLPADDASLTVHACRGPRRELEVARDRILQALDEVPDLQWHDIIILLADPSPFTPLLGGAFDLGEADGRSLPIRLLGAGDSYPAPLATAIGALLDALSGRLDLPSLSHCLRQGPVQAYLGIDDSEALITWLADAGYRWGSDGADRALRQGAAADAGPDGRWSLAGALARLALGAVVAPADRDQVIGSNLTGKTNQGVVPLDRARGLGVDALARFARFARWLERARDSWRQGATVAVWVERFQDALTNGIAARSADEEQLLADLQRGIERQLPMLGDGDPVLDLRAFRKLLAPHIDAMNNRLERGSGGITVAPLHSHGGTPARVVVICGLGADSFPRQERRPGWHPLSASYQRGDNDRRRDDRHHLLLALMEAEDRLVCTYHGGGEEDSRSCPPSTPLSDLLQAAEGFGAGIDPDDQQSAGGIHHRHGLNAFSPEAFNPHGSSGSRSALSMRPSDGRWANTLLGDEAEPTGPWRQAGADMADGEQADSAQTPLHISRSDLKDMIAQPCRLFLRAAGIALESEQDEGSGADRIALDGLEAWALSDRMLSTALNQNVNDPAEARQALRDRLEASGDLPPAALGSRAWQSALDSLPDLPEHPGSAPQFHDLILPEIDDCPSITIGGGAGGGGRWISDADGTPLWISPSATDPNARPSRMLQRLIDVLLMEDAHKHFRCRWSHKGKTTEIEINIGISDDKRIDTLRGLADMVLLARSMPIPAAERAYDQALSGAWDRWLGADPVEPDLDAFIVYWNEGSAFGGGEAPAEDPVHRRCFRGCPDPMNWAGPEAAQDAITRSLGGTSEHSLASRWLERLSELQQALVTGGQEPRS